MYGNLKEQLTRQLKDLRAQGLYKNERVITTPQSARVRVGGSAPVLNLCANNYLGLASHPAILAAAREGLEQWGYGMASVRFICGTQTAPSGLGAQTERISWHGGHDSLQLVFRRQWRIVRDLIGGNRTPLFPMS